MRDDLKNLAALMEPVTPNDPQQSTIYNFAFGAIYALARAEELGYTGHTRASGVSMQRSREVKCLATAMKERDQLPTSGEWLAGFYMNDALVRADVSYEHVTRYFTGDQNGNITVLREKALAHDFPENMLVPWWQNIRNEVNTLKHNSLEFAEGPVMPYPQAIWAINGLIDAVVWVLTRKSGAIP